MKKITYMGRDITGQFISQDYKKRFLKWCAKMWLWTKIVLGIGLGGAMIGGLVVGFVMGSTLNYTRAEEKPVIVEKIVEVARNAPVLERIAKCESGGSHYDKNGQVLINRTQDMGIMQIHLPIWGKKASEMGLNLAVEADNKKFGEWLYENYGTEPWVHSKQCWNK